MMSSTSRRLKALANPSISDVEIMRIVSMHPISMNVNAAALIHPNITPEMMRVILRMSKNYGEFEPVSPGEGNIDDECSTVLDFFLEGRTFSKLEGFEASTELIDAIVDVAFEDSRPKLRYAYAITALMFFGVKERRNSWSNMTKKTFDKLIGHRFNATSGRRIPDVFLSHELFDDDSINTIINSRYIPSRIANVLDESKISNISNAGRVALIQHIIEDLLQCESMTKVKNTSLHFYMIQAITTKPEYFKLFKEAITQIRDSSKRFNLDNIRYLPFYKNIESNYSLLCNENQEVISFFTVEAQDWFIEKTGKSVNEFESDDVFHIFAGMLVDMLESVNEGK